MGEVPIMRMEEERRRRVKRYKEKRHTRMFCKKIRYQVLKLNADRRPRIKVFLFSFISFTILYFTYDLIHNYHFILHPLATLLY